MHDQWLVKEQSIPDTAILHQPGVHRDNRIPLRKRTTKYASEHTSTNYIIE